MAKQVVTLITDDIDGSEGDRTVEFALDGVTYTIDLSDKNIGKLRKALDPYIGAGTRVSRSNGHPRGVGRGAGKPARVGRQQNQIIREWAVKNGYEISERGRIPAAVVEAFNSQR
ncbi:Lsr2 family protein [Actinoplanes sp. NPDC026623]|uniref:histone-like nucleoid-structuring protein Lsr2 n=1 Tax=Actinoplanes sp. NPDC026623 TaxID=3155610 RepID=UPI0033CAD0E9